MLLLFAQENNASLLIIIKLVIVTKMQTGDVRLEVILEKGNKTTPSYFNRKSAEEFVLFSFRSFTTTAPDPKEFVIPAECIRT